MRNVSARSDPEAARSTAVLAAPWRDPAETAAATPHGGFEAALLSDGTAGRWSYLVTAVDVVERFAPDDPRDPFDALRRLLGPRTAPTEDPDAPPFRGGVAGLFAYEAAARLDEPALTRDPDWPDAVLARVTGLLAFDHARRRVLAVGAHPAPEAARALAEDALRRLAAPSPATLPPDAPAETFTPEAPDAAYEAAVADTVARIAAGEIFQANIARAWTGRLKAGREPIEVFRRVARRAAPFSAWWRDGDLALVSASPERFLKLAPDAAGLTAQTRPIKGTRARSPDPQADAAAAAELAASAKDRAENLMIVDLMRNDLARVCTPGGVGAPDLFRVESFAEVHHLVSTVEGRLAPGRDAADLLRAAFPPGSITGAPKVQAMRVVARHERPRGPWCGTLLWAGFDGAMDSSVLIRTAAFVRDAARWRLRACAGAGIVADSEPVSERLETEAKIAGLRRALTEAA